MRYDQIAPSILEYLETKGFKKPSIALAGSAGSQRMYYRIKQGVSTYILLNSPKEDKDFHRFLRLTQFYRILKFPVPQVFCIDEDSFQVLLEDLGDYRLYDVIQLDKKKILPLYMQTIQVLVDMQTRCTQQYGECPDIGSRIFDKNQLLWETDYFLREYLLGYKKLALKPNLSNSLKKEFTALALRVNQHPKTIMHRDFQSQNIMLQNQFVRVIDYQGSRLGSVYYDLASLLLDPYVMLKESEIRELFSFYYSKSIFSIPSEEAYQEFLCAGLQRIMQALGAFCFLSEKKKLKEFAKHIKPGVKRLQWILKQVELKTLSELV